MSAPNAGHTQDIKGTNVYSTRACTIYIFLYTKHASSIDANIPTFLFLGHWPKTVVVDNVQLGSSSNFNLSTTSCTTTTLHCWLQRGCKQTNRFTYNQQTARSEPSATDWKHHTSIEKKFITVASLRVSCRRKHAVQRIHFPLQPFKSNHIDINNDDNNTHSSLGAAVAGNAD